MSIICKHHNKRKYFTKLIIYIPYSNLDTIYSKDRFYRHNTFSYLLERKVTFSAFQVSSWTFTISIPPSSKLFVLVTSNNKHLRTLLLTKGTWTFCSATARCTRRNGTGELAQAASSTQVCCLKMMLSNSHAHNYIGGVLTDHFQRTTM